MTKQLQPDEEIDHLYRLPLTEFTSARNALSKKLKGSGESELAQQVKGLQKPTATAWVVNQLVALRPEQVGELLDVGKRLMDAQEQGRASDVMTMNSERHRAVGALRAAAEGVLREAGHAAGSGQLEQVAETLYAAAVDPDGRQLLEHGRFTRGLDPAGFVVGPVLRADLKAVPDDPEAARAAEIARARAEEQLKGLEQELERSREEVQEQEAKVEAARLRLDAERERLSFLRKRSSDLKSQVSRAQKVVDESPLT